MSSELPINDDTAANERSQSGSRFDETARPNDEGFQARGVRLRFQIHHQ